MSYTSGYTPAKERTILIDMRREHILEINYIDMYVTVECGCTWKEFTKPCLRKVENAVLGPLSGKYATIGGAHPKTVCLWERCASHCRRERPGFKSGAGQW